MILREQRKAELLAAFLNSGNYFETPVTVEAFNGNATPNQIKDRIAAEI
jgi:predicted component of type VI protein secretion system